MKLNILILTTFASGAISVASPSSCIATYSERPKTNSALIQRIHYKYNTENAIAVKFSAEGLDKLRLLYHQLPISRIVNDVMLNSDKDWEKITSEIPKYFQWNNTKTSFVSINPPFTSAASLFEAHQQGHIKLLKNQSDGLALITWFIHPQLWRLKEANEFKKGIIIHTLEKADEKYYASILDLDVHDIPYLKNLKMMTVEHLITNYGVNLKKDTLRLDFHFPYAVDTATLHLHARVNSSDHPLEVSKSYSIDSIISYLESGRSVKDLIIDRQKKVEWFYFATSAKKMFELIPTESVEEVPNPFLITP